MADFDFSNPFLLDDSISPIVTGPRFSFDVPSFDIPDISSDDLDFIGPPAPVFGAPIESPNVQNPLSFGIQNGLDALISGAKKILPDFILQKLLKPDGSVDFGNLALGGAGGVALMSLLSSLGNQQQGAPRETYQSLGAAGRAPAPAPVQFQPTRDHAQSYQSMMGYAQGGPVHMKTGDFVFSKKALDNVGGIQALRQRGYPAQKIVGPGTGTSDSIPATIDGVEPARVANGEALIRGGAKMKGLQALHKQMRRA